MKPLIVTSGEPAGIGLDLCLDLAVLDIPLVVIGDKSQLQARAALLGREVQCIDYGAADVSFPLSTGQLAVISLPCAEPVKPGILNAANAPYVLEMLQFAVQGCLQGEFSGIVTAPVHKGIINQAGVAFTGHTEFLAQQCGVEQVVMLLVAENMKVALVTTHVPLSQVASLIQRELLTRVIEVLHQGLQDNFGIAKPCIFVAGLNPHAGEGGYLGREEIEIMAPLLAFFREQGMNIRGPLPADTLFSPQYLSEADVFLTMYHDQGLPVIKYASFGHAVNVTLGLPIVRTSVDHGTALELAGKGVADSASLIAAVRLAHSMALKA